ncbi:DNA pacase A subunit [Escherichia coli]|uniref:DNA pacase A subunit n=1 Tax=Escherichia coli TaxID=562 RepID=UPI0020B801F1|nr:DNA pacase A subunit [Escherichia coli]MCN2526358.1 DNA pacase A subunit [Escherichia coli]MCN7175500.1 DNA pacase A subunit [Escherichia coli]
MTLINWEAHRAKFLELREETGITIKEYCEQHDLSFNTARKHLNMKKNEVKAKAKAAGKSTKQRGKSSASGSKKEQKKADKSTEFTKTDKSLAGGRFRAMPQKQNADHKEKPSNNNKIHKDVKGSFCDEMVEMIPKSSEKAQRNKGSLQMIPDSSAQSATLPATNVAREMMKNGATEHLRLAIQMAQERAIQYQTIVDQEAERLQEEIDALGDTQPEGMHPGQRLLGLISDAAYYMNDFITRLAAIYQNEQKLRQGDEKLAQGARQQAFREAEAREKLAIARLQAEQRGKEIEYRIGADARAARVIAAAIRMREREELDDIGVAEYIERQGVSVPAILAARAAKAISLLEPPVSDVNDVDDEQLDKEAKQFAEQQAGLPQWLAQRRAEVAKIVDRLGMGDYDRNGERKAGEFEANDEDLNIDPSATADIYGDYDAGDTGFDAVDDEIAIDQPEDD